MKIKIKTLTGREVISRMKKGDLPTYGGGYTEGGFFDDGVRAARGVMRRLRKAGKVEFIGTSVSDRWKLVIS